MAQSPSVVCPSTPHLASPEPAARIIAEMLRSPFEGAGAIVDTLRAGGLKYEETSQFALVLIVDFSYNARESEWVALAVRLELYERVQLEKASPMRISTRGHSAVSWSWSDVDLVNAARAEPTLVSMAKRAAEKLVSEVKVATEVFPPKE